MIGKPAPIDDHRCQTDSAQEFYESVKTRFEFSKYYNCAFTSAFAAEDDSSGPERRWLKAVEDPQTQRWMIFNVALRMKTREDFIAAEPQLYQEPYEPQGAGLNFFEMIEVLSTYENTQPDLGFIKTDPATPHQEELHYRAIAEKEMIAFDNDNMPHPTIDGLIVTAGDFPPGTETRLAALINAPGPDLPGQKLVDQFNSQAQEEAVDYLLAGYKALETLDDLMPDFETLTAIAEYYRTDFDGTVRDYEDFSKDFKLSDDDMQHLQSDFEQDESAANFSVYCYKRIMGRIDQNLKDILDAQAYQTIHKALLVQQLYFEIFRANAFMRCIYNEHELSDAFASSYKDVLGNIASIAQETGADEEQVCFYKSLTTSAEPLEKPQNLVDLAASSQQLKQQKREDIARHKQKMKARPVPPSLKL